METSHTLIQMNKPFSHLNSQNKQFVTSYNIEGSYNVKKLQNIVLNHLIINWI